MTPVPDQSHWQIVQRVFEEALAPPRSDWDSFIARQFPDDDSARKTVLDMLAAHFASGPLDRLLDELHPPDSDDQAEPVMVGVWRIESLIGRGGSGSVYRAVRADG